MFVCCECGKIFSDTIKWKEDRGEHFGFPAYEEYYGSPCCYGSYTEAYRCDCCEEYIQTEDYIKTMDGLRYCEDCIEYMKLGDED